MPVRGVVRRMDHSYFDVLTDQTGLTGSCWLLSPWPLVTPLRLTAAVIRLAASELPAATSTQLAPGNQAPERADVP